MRVNLRNTNPEMLLQALTALRYVKVGVDEWRHQKFHLFIVKKRKKGLILSLHVDSPSSLPPFHKARHKGKDLQDEMQKILAAYQRLTAECGME